MANDFDHIGQTIKGQAIASIQYSPNKPTGIPNRLGLLHIQIPEGSEDRKIHAWISMASTPNPEWVQLLVGSSEGSGSDDATIVKTNKANDFNDVNQTIGTNQIVTIIDGGANSTPTGAADFDGQIFFSYRDAGTPEAQGAIWVAKGNQWLPVASGGSIDESNLAKLDTTNTFTDLQKIGSPTNMATFTSGRRTHLDPLASSTPDMMPFTAGDIIVRDLDDVGSDHEIYIATAESDASSWLKVYDSTLNTVDIANSVTLLDGRLDTLSDKLDTEIVDLDNLATTVGTHDSDITLLDQELGLVETKVNVLEPRVVANEQKIAALETHFDVDGRVSDIETKVTTLEAIDPVLKTGATMTGQLIIDENGDALRIKGSAAYVSGFSGDTRKWWFGKGSSSSDNFTIHNDAHDTEINLMDNKVKFNKMIYENEGRVYSPSNKPTAADLGVPTQAEFEFVEAESASTKNSVGILETDMITVKGQITALDTAVDEVKTKLPETLTAKKYLIVNAEGTGVELSSESTDDVASLAALGAGVVTGDALLSTKCLGGDTVISANDTADSVTSKSNFVFGTPASGTTKNFHLGDIVPYDSTDLSGNKVREGCLYTIVNAGAGVMRMNSSNGTQFQTRTSSGGTLDIGGNYTVLLIPQIWDGGQKRYNVVGKFTNEM